MRRKLSQRQVLDMAVRNWHRNAPFSESIRSTVGFLWLLVMLLIFGSCAAGIVAGWPRPQSEQHADDGAGAVIDGPGAQRGESRTDGEGQDVGHGADVDAGQGGGA